MLSDAGARRPALSPIGKLPRRAIQEAMIVEPGSPTWRWRDPVQEVVHPVGGGALHRLE